MPEQTKGSGNNLTSYIRDRPQRVRTALLVLLGQFKPVEENGEIWAEVEARTGRVTKASAATARSLVAGAGPKLGSGGARPSPRHRPVLHRPLVAFVGAPLRRSPCAVATTGAAPR